MKPCPKCGKPMEEQPKFPGLWSCPDCKNAINEAPPFKYLCTGMEITDEGVKEFEGALATAYQNKNPDVRIANGQIIEDPSPAHFIHAQSGQGSGLGVAEGMVVLRFGLAPFLSVVAAHRKHPRQMCKARPLGHFILN